MPKITDLIAPSQLTEVLVHIVSARRITGLALLQMIQEYATDEDIKTAALVAESTIMSHTVSFMFQQENEMDWQEFYAEIGDGLEQCH